MERNAAIIVIGNEILSGDTQDTNSYWLAQNLFSLGVKVELIITVPDDIEVIDHFVRPIRDKFSFILVSGGIGPTPDDVTRQAIARVYDAPLEVNEDAKKALVKFYHGDVNDVRLQMAHLPVGCRLIANELTGAPGFAIGNCYVFPGIPRLLHEMFEEVRDEFATDPIYSGWFTCNIGESRFAHLMLDAQERFPMVSVGSYPRLEGSYRVKVVCRSRNERQMKDALAFLETGIRRLEHELLK
jgi:molybdenum cofactor synthesis domain-containing protein